MDLNQPLPELRATCENGLDALNRIGRPLLRVMGVLIFFGLGIRLLLGQAVDPAVVGTLFAPVVVDLLTRSTEVHREIRENAYTRNMLMFGTGSGVKTA